MKALHYVRLAKASSSVCSVVTINIALVETWASQQVSGAFNKCQFPPHWLVFPVLINCNKVKIHQCGMIALWPAHRRPFHHCSILSMGTSTPCGLAALLLDPMLAFVCKLPVDMLTSSLILVHIPDTSRILGYVQCLMHCMNAIA